MSIAIDARGRLLLILLVVVLAAAAAWLMVLPRLTGNGTGSATPTTPATHREAAPAFPTRAKTPSHPRSAAPSKAHGRASSTRTKAPARTGAKAPAHASRTRKPAVVPVANRLPRAIRRALAADHIVVVSLYDPRAAVDETALREAKAGARLAGSSFVPVDVRTNSVDSLNALYGVIQDPAVLVLRPPENLVVRIDGFADRETVAQAAVNAAS